MNKCRFGETEVKIVGHIVSPEGIRTDPVKTKAIAEFLSLKILEPFKVL